MGDVMREPSGHRRQKEPAAPSRGAVGQGSLIEIAKDRDRAVAGSYPADPLAAWLPARRPDRFAILFIAAMAFLAFANSLGNGFVFDDIPIVRENPVVRHPSLRAIFGGGYWPQNKVFLYRPLVILSYAFNYAAAGIRPFTYHLVNVLLHALNGVLVYLILVALFRARGLALVSAAAFALHPIHTEAVANVVGRAELLSNAFLFLAWLWYLKRDEAPAPSRSRWLVGSILAAALALFAKEHAPILLGLLILSDLFRARERGLPVGATIRERFWAVYPWYLLPLAGYLVARYFVLGGLLTPQFSWISYPPATADLWSRYMTTVKGLGMYIWLLFFPVRLSSDYSYNQIPLSHSIFDPPVVASLLALLGVLGVGAWNWRRRPEISMGVGIFALAILPVSNLVFPIGTIIAERLLYLPSLGFCLILGVAVTRLAAYPRWRPLAMGALGLLLVAYGARTVVRNWDWRSNLTLFAAAARASPNSTDAHAYLGQALLEHENLSGARREFERSLEIYPGYNRALVGLGTIFEKQGKLEEAVQAYRKVKKGKQYYGRARLNLGFIALKQGRDSEAVAEFREVAQLSFLGPKESTELAEGFFKLGHLTEARTILETARHYAPDVFYVRENLALVYWRQGLLEDAQRELEAATRLKRASP